MRLFETEIQDDDEIQECYTETHLEDIIFLHFDCGHTTTIWNSSDLPDQFAELERVTAENKCPSCGFTTNPPIQEPLPIAAPTADIKKIVHAGSKLHGQVTLDASTGQILSGTESSAKALIADEMGYDSIDDLNDLPNLALVLKTIAQDIWNHTQRT